MKTRRIPFIKMHGAGNDFVFINRAETKVPLTKKNVQLLMDRHFGIGGDQLLALTPGNSTRDPRLKIYNADGSLAEMCGNGVRAVAYYLREFKEARRDFVLQTDAGPIGIGLKKNKIEVDMGKPKWIKKKKTLTIKGKIFAYYAASMGNPHAVIFVKNVKTFPIHTWGPLIENHSLFPKRTNVEFVQVKTKNNVRARVWERGAGETLACGTGACAIGVVGATIGVTAKNLKIDLPGGQLGVRWANNDHVYLTGPADVTYSGHFLL